MADPVHLFDALSQKEISARLANYLPEELEAFQKTSEAANQLVLHHLIYNNQGQRVTYPQFLDELSLARPLSQRVCFLTQEPFSIMSWDVTTKQAETVVKLPDDNCLIELLNEKIYLWTKKKGLEILDPSTGTPVTQCPLEGLQTSEYLAYFKFFGNRLYGAFYDGTFLAWSTVTGKIEACFKQLESPITHLIEQEGFVAISCKDGTLRLWPLQGGAPLVILRDTVEPIDKLAIYKSTLITASFKTCLCFWDLETGQKSLTLLKKNAIFALVDHWLYTPSSGDAKRLAMINVLTGKEERQFDNRHKGPISMICTMGDGLIATYGADQTAKIWKAKSGELLQSFELQGFDLRTMIYLQGKIIFLSKMNIFGAYDFTRPISVSTSPRIAFVLKSQREKLI